MGDNVQLDYTIDPTGAAPATIAGIMGAVPIPLDVVSALGLRVTVSGVPVPVATPVKRTIKMAFGPSVIATAVAVLGNVGDSGHPIDRVMVTAPGLDYILPPQIIFVGGGAPPPSLGPNILVPAKAQAFLNVQAISGPPTGLGYTAAAVAHPVGAMSSPTFGPDGNFTVPSCVQGVNVANPGKHYSPAATIEFQGGLDVTNPLSRQAQAVITKFGPHGEVLAVQVTDPGAFYIRVPKAVIIDPASGVVRDQLGTTGHLAAQMGAGTPATIALTVIAGVITAAVVVTNGSRYIGVPTIVVTDPAGVGAVLVARMGVGSIDMVTRGRGFTTAPTITINPFFKSQFPDASDQRAPFWRLMETAFAVASISPVTSADPVVT